MKVWQNWPFLLVIATASTSLCFAGCATAEMVATTGGKHEYGPVNEGPRGGVVRYLNQGADWVRQERRDDAYKKMSGHCTGKYRIVKEGPEKGSSGMAVPIGGMWFAGVEEYWAIQFECVE